MNMQLIDWGIVVGLLIFLVWAARKTSKYTKSVADFLAANRCAGRYLLGVADSSSGIGAITIVAWFEAYYIAGFTFVWWQFPYFLVILIASLSGWIQYRYRETRALTMAQFMEMRYGRRFRIFAGIVAFVAGTISFGIFPAVGARFFIYFCQLPTYDVALLGGYTISLTFVFIMLILLAFSLYFTFAGGQIAVIVTDYAQGIFANIMLVIIIALLLIKFPWSQISETLSMLPAGKSMLHPFDTSKIEAFDKWFYLIYAFAIFWCWMAWQGSQGYYVSAYSSHEARMGRVISSWRQLTTQYLLMVLPICAFVAMHNINWTAAAENTTAMLNQVSTNPEDAIRKQVTVATALTQLLPAGLLGGFCAVMMAAFIANHETYLHSWGSIFIQDVYLPIRRKHLSPKEHIKLLRLSIVGVAIFIFLFSIFFAQYDFVLMFLSLTGTIWLGGAGTVIVGGLYWKRGTTAAAYCALMVGIVTFVFGFVMQKTWPIYHDGAKFPINSQWLWFIAMIISIVSYAAISLLGKKTEFDMDKLLHRGKYAIGDDVVVTIDEKVPRWQKLLGISSEFTFKDKLVYLAITGWSIGWGVIFIAVTAYNLIFDVKTESWTKFWHFFVWLVLGLGIITTIWFCWGGLLDLKKMFNRLKTTKQDEADDGTVIHSKGE